MLWTLLLPMHARPMDIILVKEETCFSKVPKTVCPSGLRGWTQVPLAQAAWVQIPQLSILLSVWTPGFVKHARMSRAHDGRIKHTQRVHGSRSPRVHAAQPTHMAALAHGRDVHTFGVPWASKSGAPPAPFSTRTPCTPIKLGHQAAHFRVGTECLGGPGRVRR